MSQTCGHDHTRAGKWGLIGGALSLLCAIHCLALPLLLPVASALVHATWLEALLLSAAAVVGGFALKHGYAKHGFRFPAVAFVLALVLIAAGTWLVPGPDHGRSAVALGSLWAGGVLIVIAHVGNFVLERRWVREHSQC